jgi:hypothetical protein
VNSIKIEVILFVEGFTTLGFRDGSERSQRRREFTTIDPFTIAANLKQSFVIPELTTAHSAMKLLRRPVSFRIGVVGRVARMDSRESRSVSVKPRNNFFSCHSRSKNRRRSDLVGRGGGQHRRSRCGCKAATDSANDQSCAVTEARSTDSETGEDIATPSVASESEAM